MASLAIQGRTRRPAAQTHQHKSLLSPIFALDLILIAILAGPVQVIEVMGKAPTLFWADLVVLFFAARMLYSGLTQSRKIRMPSPLGWFCVYLIVSALTIPRADDILFTIATYKLRVFPVIVLLTAYYVIKTEADVRHFVLSMIIFGVLVSLQIWYYWAAINQGASAPLLTVVRSSKDMAQTSFGRSNYLASILIVAIPFGLYLCGQLKFKKQVLALCSVAVMMSALLLTESRGGLVSLASGIVVLLILGLIALWMPLRYLAMLLLLSVGLGGAAIMIWSYLPAETTHDLTIRFEVLQEDFQAGNYGSNRSALWREAYDHFWGSPVLGIGLGNQQTQESQLDMYSSAHNVYLEVLLETGLLGFVPIAIFLTQTGWTWFKLARPPTSRTAKGLAFFGLLTYLVVLINATEEPSFWNPQYAYIVWMTFGLGLAMARMERIRRRSSERTRSLQQQPEHHYSYV